MITWICWRKMKRKKKKRGNQIDLLSIIDLFLSSKFGWSSSQDEWGVQSFRGGLGCERLDGILTAVESSNSTGRLWPCLLAV